MIGNNIQVAKCKPGATVRFTFALLNDSNQDWFPDSKLVCDNPLVYNNAFDLVLLRQQQSKFTFEITLPDRLQDKEIELNFMASSAAF